MLLIASKLAFTYIYNEIVIGKYNEGEFDGSLKPVFICNWIQPYIAHYNAGNIYYQNGEFDKAIEEYKLAMKREPKRNHKCDIRINMALAMINALPEDYASEENVENTIAVLKEARALLIQDGCAKDKEDGHSEPASKLREEIDNMLKEAEGSGDGEGKEDEGDPNEEKPNDKPEEETENEREQEIKNQMQQQQNNAYKERNEDKLFYEELEEEFGNYFEEPVW